VKATLRLLSITLAVAAPSLAAAQIVRGPQCGTNVQPTNPAAAITLEHVAVQNVYWGDYWRTNPQGRHLREQIDAGMHTALGDQRFYDAISEYDLSWQPITGYYVGSDQVSTSQIPYLNSVVWWRPMYLPTTGSGSITAELLNELVSRQITDQSANGYYRLFVIYLPPNVHDSYDYTFNLTTRSYTQRYIANHRVFTGAYGGSPPHPIYYSVVEFSSDASTSTVSESHEIWEAITDGDGVSGFRDLNGGAGGGESEIGDLCSAWDTLDGVSIQTIYSQAQCGCVYPSGLPQH
jgi:hypothetical protein